MRSTRLLHVAELGRAEQRLAEASPGGGPRRPSAGPPPRRPARRSGRPRRDSPARLRRPWASPAPAGLRRRRRRPRLAARVRPRTPRGNARARSTSVGGRPAGRASAGRPGRSRPASSSVRLRRAAARPGPATAGGRTGRSADRGPGGRPWWCRGWPVTMPLLGEVEDLQRASASGRGAAAGRRCGACCVGGLLVDAAGLGAVVAQLDHLQVLARATPSGRVGSSVPAAASIASRISSASSRRGLCRQTSRLAGSTARLAAGASEPSR